MAVVAPGAGRAKCRRKLAALCRWARRTHVRDVTGIGRQEHHASELLAYLERTQGAQVHYAARRRNMSRSRPRRSWKSSGQQIIAKRKGKRSSRCAVTGQRRSPSSTCEQRCAELMRSRTPSVVKLIPASARRKRRRGQSRIRACECISWTTVHALVAQDKRHAPADEPPELAVGGRRQQQRLAVEHHHAGLLARVSLAASPLPFSAHRLPCACDRRSITVPTSVPVGVGDLAIRRVPPPRAAAPGSRDRPSA